VLISALPNAYVVDICGDYQLVFVLCSLPECSEYVQTDLNWIHVTLVFFFLKMNLYAGLLTAVHSNYFNVLDYRELLFNDIGDRVAQLLHVESAMPFLQNRSTSCVHQQSLIVNTHLLFPHDHSLSIVRLRQVETLFFSTSKHNIFNISVGFLKI
jgi:hypothetical protein